MPSSEVFSKYKAGTLRSGSKKGPPVKNHAQAVAIFLSEKRAEGQHGGKYPEKQFGGPQSATGQPPFPGHFGLNPPPMGMNPQPMQGFGTPPMGMPGPMGMGMRADGGNVLQFPSRSNLFDKELAQSPDQVAQNRTSRILSQVLGRQNVLPIGPDDGKAAGGGLGGYQFGGSPTAMGLTPGWIERQEARNISHTGPIISSVGGRTDHHSINVPSGSYVMPADSVSHLGQGNTLNGMQILRNMFGSPMKMPHGAGPPRTAAPRSLMPRTPGLGMSSAGGSRGDAHVGKPVPIMAAGGEFIIQPHIVQRIGGGNMDRGHKILDHWVLSLRKKHIQKLKGLPPPAKS